jgi:hypothetical protein
MERGGYHFVRELGVEASAVWASHLGVISHEERRILVAQSGEARS